MPTLDWLNREAAFRESEKVPTHVLRPHSAGHTFGDDAAGSGNLQIHGDNLQALRWTVSSWPSRAVCGRFTWMVKSFLLVASAWGRVSLGSGLKYKGV
jgi:hypothetical protein